MKLLSKSFNLLKKPNLFGLILFTIFLVPSVFAQAKLTLGDIFTGLRSKKVTIEERNRLLADAVKSRGITFAVTSEIEKELAETGGNKVLIEAIKLKAVVVPTTPAPTPIATLAPTIATPAPTPAQLDYAAFQKKADSNFVKGEYDFAVINYTKAAELNPKESSIYLSRGLVYYNRKFYDLAIADYGKAIEIDPKEMMAYYYRGDSYEKLGELQKATDDFKKVVELDSTNDIAKANVQRLEAELNKNKPAATIIPTVAKTEPTPTSEPTKPAESTISTETPQIAELGSLVGFAIKLVQPNYPQSARNLYIGGEVLVNVTIDEEGNPIAVKAVSGAPTLRSNCEDAVKRSKFKPTLIDNKPVKAKGFITFKFKPF